MEEICLTLRVLTPMFLAGADGKTAELRATSVKGVMRFWWRTRLPNLSVADLRQKEGYIFGAAGEKESHRSAVALAVEAGQMHSSKEPLPWHGYTVTRSSGRSFPINILEYLAYGTYERNKEKKQNVLTREYFVPGSTFNLRLRVRDQKVLPDVVVALRLLCLFGALGAKAHNGYGSFRVEEVTSSNSAVSEELRPSLPDKRIMENLCAFAGRPAFSAFSKEAKLFRTRQRHVGWDGCLAELARAYREARLSLEKRHEYEMRQYLGAPIVVNNIQVSSMDRRAKPYFMRVHAESGGRFVGYVLYLPSRYLPQSYHPRLGMAEQKYQQVDVEEADKKFRKICSTMNQELAQKMEVVF